MVSFCGGEVKSRRKGFFNNIFFFKTEIVAATEAGYQVVISDRPGNAPLGPESKQFKIVTSFDQI